MVSSLHFERLTGLINTVTSTKNWFSVLLFYFGLRDEVTAVFRNNSSDFTITNKSQGEYWCIRDLVAAGVDAERGGDGFWKFKLPRGITLYSKASAAPGRSIYECFFKRAYEPDQDLTGKTVVDAGAFIADSSIFFASKGAHVYAFEPDRESFDMAVRNIRANGMDSLISIFPLALGQSTSNLALFLDSQHPDSNTLFPLTSGRLYDGREVVKTISLVTFMVENKIERINLLKLDCEGCEFDVICEANAQALRRTDEIILEYHRAPAPLIDLLTSMNFKVKIKRYPTPAFGMIHASHVRM